MRTRLGYATGVLILIVLSLTSCGPRVIAQGILLWSTDEISMDSGSVVDILAESELRQSYDIRYTDKNGEEQFAEVPFWRITISRNKDHLLSLQEEYSQYAEYTAVAEIQALPVRDAMGTDKTVSIIYRMREGEKAKILSRTEEEITVGGLTDYWFEILTEDGTRGYVFGYRLDVIDASGESIEQEAASADPLLSAVLNNVWRPDYFEWMIEDGRYDLLRFRNSYQFTHNPVSKSFTLTTENFSSTFEYTDIYRARYKEYVVEGSSLQIITYDERNISIQFTEDGRTYQESLVRIDADIEEIIQDELTRRSDLLDSFVNRGTIFRSNSYGTIRLTGDGSLSWTGYNAVGSNIIPEWFSGTAKISFPLYLVDDLQQNADGAITVSKPGISIHDSMNFLFRFSNGGIQLEYIPAQSISRNVIEKQALSPFIIFFTID